MLKLNDGLHFYSQWMHNEQSMGLLIRLLLACAYLLKVGMCRNENLGFCKEKNHTWNARIYEIMRFCIEVLLFCLWKGGSFFQTFHFWTQLYLLLPILHIYLKSNSIDQFWTWFLCVHDLVFSHLWKMIDAWPCW